MKSNNTPKAYADVTTLALAAIAGAEAHGAAVNLSHNTADHLKADFHALGGDGLGVIGRQTSLDSQLRAMRTTQDALDAALKAARDFCHLGIGILKPLLWHRWNSDWHAAGFTAGSLSVPRVPLSLLVELRVFLEANPQKESESIGFTAVGAQARIEAVTAATQARDSAKGARWSVKAARDAAFRALRKRLSNLRAELAQLLAPTDDRWYAFGFRRPADGRIPAPVKGVTATEIAPGTVKVEWTRSARAETYRVVAQATGDEARQIEAIVVADRARVITGVPDGSAIVIEVTARNRSGETRAVQVLWRPAALVECGEGAALDSSTQPITFRACASPDSPTLSP